MRILITEQNFGDDAAVERALVAETEHELVVESCVDEADVVDALGRYRPDVLLVQFVPIGPEAIARADGVRAIVRCGNGVDTIDLSAAAARGIAVARVPDYCIDEVADHTLALVLAVERKLLATAGGTREGAWDYRAGGPMRRLRGRSFGLLGFGQIARAVAQRAQGFGFRMLAHDPAVPADGIEDAGVEPVGFDDLIARSDVLGLHVPLSAATRGVIGAAELARLPEGAVVINTARGGLIDEAALLEALRRGRLGGAGIDVLGHEPPPADHPLRTAPRLVLTPHAGWYSETASVELRRKTVEACLLFLRGESPNGLVAP